MTTGRKLDMNGGVIVLVKDMTWVSATAQGFSTDWVSFPAEHQNAQLVVIIKTRIAGSLTNQLQTTWDTDSATDTGSSVTGAATGTSVVNITSGLGPVVHLNLMASGQTELMFSAYLTPKSD